MSSRSAPPAIPKRNRLADAGEQAVLDGTKTEQLGSVPPDESISQKLLQQLNGDEGAGYAISFVVHVILLALLAIPIVRSTREDQSFTTLVQKSSDETVVFEDPIETVIPMPVSDSAGGDPQSQLLEMKFDNVGAISDLNLSNNSMPSGEDTAGGVEGVQGGQRVAEPKSAVKAGNFSVWPWPLSDGRIKPDLRNPKLGEPGENPRPGQNYLIVIRIRAPEGVKSLKITDFSGTVVGTDSYTQEIPEGCFQFTASGQLVPIRLRPRIPVINGTAELVLLVPGAEALVEDTIKVRSETLDEEQEIKLIFKSKRR